jgi:hypothetical protein
MKNGDLFLNDILILRPFSTPRNLIFFQLAAFIGNIRTGFGVRPLAVLACCVLPLVASLVSSTRASSFRDFKGRCFIFRCCLGPQPSAVPVGWRQLPSRAGGLALRSHTWVAGPRSPPAGLVLPAVVVVASVPVDAPAPVPTAELKVPLLIASISSS